MDIDNFKNFDTNSAYALSQVSAHIAHTNSERLRIASEIQKQTAKRDLQAAQASEATIELLSIQKEQFQILKNLNDNQAIQVEILKKLNEHQALSEIATARRDLINRRLVIYTLAASIIIPLSIELFKFLNY